MADTGEHINFQDLRREAREWVIWIRSGEATAEDTAALLRWRARSADHSAALSEAIALRRLVAIAGKDEPLSAAVQGLAFMPQRASQNVGHGGIGRRAFLGGAMAASAAGIVVVRPPLGLWPSLSELSADYRTSTGQRRTIALAKGASVELNTRTSVALASDNRLNRLDLIAGEVAVDAINPVKPVAIRTDAGEAVSKSGRYGVRLEGAETCVTCLAGRVEIVTALAGDATLRPGEQLSFASGALGKIVSVDPQKAESWRRGLLIFTNEPLSQVVNEINRYRSGKIILANSDLRSIPVNAVFQLDRMDRALSQIREVADARETVLPGGVVVLS